MAKTFQKQNALNNGEIQGAWLNFTINHVLIN